MGRSGYCGVPPSGPGVPPQSPPLLTAAGWPSPPDEALPERPRAERSISSTLTGMSETADAVDDVPQPMRESFLVVMAKLRD